MNTTNENDTEDYNGNRATYSPEDNKLRLYVGRVPRDEYEKLRAEGWVALHKQREAGGGDFAAVWTPERRDTALEYAGVIEDEDMGPAERAADRAERFGLYRDKRTDEATGRADRFDAGPTVHGYQSQARGERAAARHDRIAARACDAWSKAEYWQRRTAGVIAHALHRAAPGVRMGRIVTLETELRLLRKRWEGQQMSERAADWVAHLELRLGYENAMIEAEGGRLASVEMVCGGFLYGKQIYKVNKSPATGRVTSVCVKVPRVTDWTYRVENVPFTDYALAQFDTERLPPDTYRAPTAEELAAYEATRAAEKAAAKAKKPDPIPLVNPTDEDAERLQALWNSRVIARGEKRRQDGNRHTYCPELEGEQSTVLRTTQAAYSANSGGTYSHAKTVEVEAGGKARTGYRGQYTGRVVAKVRTASGANYKADRVIVITDKPRKPFPAALWVAPVVAQEVAT
jgi:hypothetical protein